MDRIDRDGRSALHMAAHANDPAWVAELIRAGADLDLQGGSGCDEFPDDAGAPRDTIMPFFTAGRAPMVRV